MGPRSPSFSDGEVPSEAEEKVAAIRTTSTSHRSTNVDPSARPTSSSRASHPPGPRDLPRREEIKPPAPPSRPRSRSRSPWRADRSAGGVKRKYGDSHYKRPSDDPRRFKVVHENDHGSRSHADVSLTNGAKKYAGLGDEREHDRSRRQPTHPDRSRDRSRSPFRHRSRSRSPFRHSKTRRVGDTCLGSQLSGSDDDVSLHPRGSSALSKQREPDLNDDSRSIKPRVPFTQPLFNVAQAKRFVQTSPLLLVDSHHRVAGGKPSKEIGGQDEEPEQPQQKLSEEDIIEQRRKRRQALRVKHTTQPDLRVQTLEQTVLSAPATPSELPSSPTSNTPGTPHGDSPPDSPAAFAVDDVQDLANHHHQVEGAAIDEGPSAADYDPNMDMQEDRPDHKKLNLPDSLTAPIQASEVEAQAGSALGQSKEFDMFADDDDDMFAPSDAALKSMADAKEAKTLDQSLLDNWDYPDGHYRIILNELLDGRYAVQQQIGKGTFATVVRAQDAKTGQAVAIKIACNNDTMYKAGQKEMDILQHLNSQDPDDKKHVIRLQRSFVHKAHLCLVFENMNADLREVLKKFGRNVGISPQAIRSYAQQMFFALAHMQKCEVIHADLKPDNVLISDKLSVLKVCDLGTATTVSEAEITPYLVSRFYRAPEVILGMEIGYPIDMWSIGCTLFELYTGRILFAGADNNQMLRVIQECRGKLPMRMLKVSQLAAEHFDQEGVFISLERNKITGKISSHRMPLMKSAAVVGKDLRTRLGGNVQGLSLVEKKEHEAFVDLMDKCLQLDPHRRITPGDALKHHFIAHPKAVVTTEKSKVIPAMGVAWKR